MLTRLADRIESGSNGEEIIIRYGMWGTTAEIERHGRKFRVIHKGKKLNEFDTLQEASVLLSALADSRK